MISRAAKAGDLFETLEAAGWQLAASMTRRLPIFLLRDQWAGFGSRHFTLASLARRYYDAKSEIHIVARPHDGPILSRRLLSSQ